MFHTCKITVVQKGINKTIINTYLNNPERVSLCDRVDEKQEFIVTNPYEMPDTMCASAWADIRPYILTIASGGSFEMMKEKHTALATCTDLFRPVIFKIERA